MFGPPLVTEGAEALAGSGLSRLEKLDPRQARIVELRYFSGLTAAEVGEVLGVSSKTVMREWNTAKAWLYGKLFVALLTEKLIHHACAVSPWGYLLEVPPRSQPMA